MVMEARVNPRPRQGSLASGSRLGDRQEALAQRSVQAGIADR